jgi:hypothetical protein
MTGSWRLDSGSKVVARERQRDLKDLSTFFARELEEGCAGVGLRQLASEDFARFGGCRVNRSRLSRFDRESGCEERGWWKSADLFKYGEGMGSKRAVWS